ncbi:MAG: PIG-L family deacetylase [Candidatus Omnitrophica bacterium]|nr:PIG-L family deacetylase [Candidatus Omnitrophota bacterium]
MLKKTILLLTILVFAFGCAWADSASKEPVIPDIEPIQKKDRILILAPHPDDEAIGCAGIIQEALRQGAKVKVVYLTNGDSNQLAFIVYEKRLTFKKGEFIHMGEVRREEAIAAMQSLGLDKGDLTFLGYPDFGTFAIFMNHWNNAAAFRSLLTKANSVPYKEDLSYGKPYKGESILEDLEGIIGEYKPNKIFVSHPADTNGDHRALYLFLQVALSDLGKIVGQPKIYPYLVHCVGWPLPRHYHPELPLLPPKQLRDSPVQWSRYLLDAQELEKKHEAILLYRSQTNSSAFYLLAFARKNELFGDYPELDLNLSVPYLRRIVKQHFDPLFKMSPVDKNTDAETAAQPQTRPEGRPYVTYELSGNSLLIRINNARELNRRFTMLFYLFGYSCRTPFGQMPKIRIIARHERLKVFDGRKIINPQGLSAQLDDGEFILKVPLSVLGDPDYILSSMKAYSRILPSDIASFRKINIRR